MAGGSEAFVEAGAVDREEFVWGRGANDPFLAGDGGVYLLIGKVCSTGDRVVFRCRHYSFVRVGC